MNQNLTIRCLFGAIIGITTATLITDNQFGIAALLFIWFLIMQATKWEETK